MEPLGKMLILAGLGLVGLGVMVWLLGRRSGGGWLPGDIVVQRGNFKFYFPVVTCLVVSVVLSALARWWRK